MEIKIEIPEDIAEVIGCGNGLPRALTIAGLKIALYENVKNMYPENMRIVTWADSEIIKESIPALEDFRKSLQDIIKNEEDN